jgi:SulP family sulfate permease
MRVKKSLKYIMLLHKLENTKFINGDCSIKSINQESVFAIKNFLPFLPTIQTYDRLKLRADLLAALTVAMVALPQSMAFALIVGIEPQYGVYAIIVGSMLGALFGSSRHLHTGPTNTSSIVVAGAMAGFFSLDNFLGLLFLLSFLTGFFQFSAGILKLGSLTQFISRAVLIGFAGGASILIMVSQLPNLLGLPRHASLSILEGVLNILRNINNINSPTFLIGLGTIFFVIILNRLSPKSKSGVPYLPSYLLGVLGAAAVVMVAQLTEKGVVVVGKVPGTLPPLSLPAFDFQSIRLMLASALALSLISTAEAIASGKSTAILSGDRIQSNQELIGQGLAKMGVAFFSGMPVSGSFTRTVLNFRAGAQTQFSGFFSGLILLAMVLLFTPIIKYIPVAALAGIIIVIATKMISWKNVKLAFKATRSDAAVMLATFFATLLFHLDTAIFIGVGLSLFLFLRQVRRPRLIELDYDEVKGFHELKQSDQRHIPEISIVHLEGDIFFGAVDFFEDEIGRIANRDGLKVLILRMKRAYCLDATSIIALMQFIEKMKKNDKLLIISGVRGEVEEIFRRLGIDKVIGEENIFFSDTTILQSTRRALARAVQYINSKGERKYRLRLFYDKPEKARLNPTDDKDDPK